MRDNIEVPVDTIKLADGLEWEDGWFATGQLDGDTLAIGEPAYHQRNWSYLIRDGGEALLFDTGSGRRPIAPLVARRSRGAQVTAFPSHMHFDHLGNINAFGPVMVADLPMLRACETDGRLTPADDMFLGHYEDLAVPTFEVGRWARPGETISVGSRRLKVIHTPGHSPDSVSLWEPDRNRLYAADFIYRGALYAQTPGASLTQYRETCRQLLETTPETVEIVCAHGRPVGGLDEVPVVRYADLLDVHDVLSELLAGKPHTGEAPVNGRMFLLYSADSFTA
ncbi:MAG: MBL fold metallo-hydrolase [Anderseniella sp.]|jgi:glyoxylase-like metal-dependent hydrolase (beta-lactamase superfamily II)|nr:MBL fold metallo-hydrolase [Anderseniella sp.]